MPRSWVWLQLLIGWLPVGALFAALILAAHPNAGPAGAVIAAGRMMVAGAVLGFPVYRLTRRVRWPDPMRVSFVAIHLLAAVIYSAVFVALNSAMESVVRGHAVVIIGGAGLSAFIVLGVWLYVMIAGVAYANEATVRAARAEAAAARSQLAALRSQLNPHFLFNALHTVVQLIPRDPARAGRAAEEVAGLLRTTLEENRDLVSLEEELAFVRRYLGVERIRFGDRLAVTENTPDDVLDARVPVFAVQTLVENAVRHGAAPRVEPTTITVSARADDGMLTVTVHDTGAGAPAGAVARSRGTGLRRLRERLDALYGGRARLALDSPREHGFTASLSIPLSADEARPA